jgi:hypothetical protein
MVGMNAALNILADFLDLLGYIFLGGIVLVVVLGAAGGIILFCGKKS